jgi:Leucine-rich repeat (LRR) protein
VHGTVTISKEALSTSDQRKPAGLNVTSKPLLFFIKNSIIRSLASKEFCFCQSLEILHFQDNGLQVLPRAMDRMTVLKVLRLDHNCLESLVGGIGMLQSCQSMDLSHNRLSELPAFPALYSLTSLALSNNKITQFPDSLTELSSLLMLDLSYNSIIAIPSFTALLKKLTFFDLSHNRIDDLHPKLWKLSDLEVLKLDHNNMGGVRPENVELGNMLAMMGQKAPALNYQTITDNVSKLVNLRTFTLSNNSLQNLPSSLGTMTSSPLLI